MIANIIETGLQLIDKVIPDPKQRDAARLKLMQLEKSGELATLKAQSQIIVSEAQSESWITRSWRPLVMLMFAIVIANNYLLEPVLHLIIGINYDMPNIPTEMWRLMDFGLGGYVIGRSGERIARALGGKK